MTAPILGPVPPPARRLRIVMSLPPRELWPNARPHRLAKARAAKAYRRTAWGYALASPFRNARWPAAVAMVRAFFPDARGRDEDNLGAALKPLWDGIADAGVVVNDHCLHHLPMGRAVDRANPRLEVEVWEALPPPPPGGGG